MKLPAILIFAMAILLLSCSNKNSDNSEKFVGTWKSIVPHVDSWTTSKAMLHIEKVGENFTVQIDEEIIKSVNVDKNTYHHDYPKNIYSYNKEKDKLEASSGMFSNSIIFDPKSGHILSSNLEYEKIIKNMDDDKTKIKTSDNNYAAHSDFQAFWSDFKKAVNTGDKNAVIQMTNIPFKDYTVFQPGKTGQLLSANSSQQFLTNYGKIFTPSLITAMNEDKYEGWTEGSFKVNKGEYILDVIIADPFTTYTIKFTKKGDIYKLTYIVFGQ